MVEREQGAAHRADEAVPRDDEATFTQGVASSTAAPVKGSGEKAEHERARFLAVLDEVMSDHHDVLAALAK